MLGTMKATTGSHPTGWHPIVRLDKVLRNAELLSKVSGTYGASARQDLQLGLERLQVIPIDRRAYDAQPHSELEPQFGDFDALRELMAIASLPQDWKFSLEDQHRVASKMDQAMNILRETDPSLHRAICVLVGKFLFARLPGYEGGSRTSVVGVIWIGLDASAPAEEFAVLIAHEFVHQCIFLDDMIHQIFLGGEPELAESSALVVSALRKVPRGYDKAYHSAFVAVTIETLYRVWGDRRAGSLLASTRESVKGLLEKPQYISRYGYEALKTLEGLTEEVCAN
jgi:hypothetical protein